MLNKAMNTMETIRKAEETRAALINEAREVLVVLDAINKETIISNNITINKGQIVKVEIKDETLQKAYEDLKDELKTKDGIIEHQATTITALKEQIAELEAKINTPMAPTFEVVDDPMYNEPDEIEEEESTDKIEGLIDVPANYMKNEEIAELYNYWVNNIRNQEGNQFLPKEQMVANAIRKANELLTKAMDKMDKTAAYNIKLEETWKDGIIVNAFGYITLNGKEYAFRYDASFDLPCVYGCMDMALIEEARDVLDSMVPMMKANDPTYHRHQVCYSFENNIVVWETDDGCFKGYTDKYAFVWDPQHAQPCGITVINALSSFRKYRKMNKSWGNGFVARAEFIMNYCKAYDKAMKSGWATINTDEDLMKEALSYSEETVEETNEIVIENNEELNEDEVYVDPAIAELDI